MTKSNKAHESQSFEEMIQSLEKIVNLIEGDEVKLEDALKHYQDGISLLKSCQDKLTQIEQQVKIFDANNNDLKDFNIE